MADNLRSFNEMEPEERKAMQRKGGINSGKARRERKAMREQAEMLLSLPIKKTKTKDKLKELGIKNGDLNNQMALIVSMYHKALSGDVSAASWIRDIVGEKPVDKINVDGALPVVIVGEDELTDGDEDGINKD